MAKRTSKRTREEKGTSSVSFQPQPVSSDEADSVDETKQINEEVVGQRLEEMRRDINTAKDSDAVLSSPALKELLRSRKSRMLRARVDDERVPCAELSFGAKPSAPRFFSRERREYTSIPQMKMQFVKQAFYQELLQRQRSRTRLGADEVESFCQSMEYALSLGASRCSEKYFSCLPLREDRAVVAAAEILEFSDLSEEGALKGASLLTRFLLRSPLQLNKSHRISGRVLLSFIHRFASVEALVLSSFAQSPLFDHLGASIALAAAASYCRSLSHFATEAAVTLPQVLDRLVAKTLIRVHCFLEKGRARAAKADEEKNATREIGGDNNERETEQKSRESPDSAAAVHRSNGDGEPADALAAASLVCDDLIAIQDVLKEPPGTWTALLALRLCRFVGTVPCSVLKKKVHAEGQGSDSTTSILRTLLEANLFRDRDERRSEKRVKVTATFEQVYDHSSGRETYEGDIEDDHGEDDGSDAEGVGEH